MGWVRRHRTWCTCVSIYIYTCIVYIKVSARLGNTDQLINPFTRSVYTTIHIYYMCSFVICIYICIYIYRHRPRRTIIINHVTAVTTSANNQLFRRRGFRLALTETLYYRRARTIKMCVCGCVWVCVSVRRPQCINSGVYDSEATG